MHLTKTALFWDVNNPIAVQLMRTSSEQCWLTNVSLRTVSTSLPEITQVYTCVTLPLQYASYIAPSVTTRLPEQLTLDRRKFFTDRNRFINDLGLTAMYSLNRIGELYLLQTLSTAEKYFPYAAMQVQQHHRSTSVLITNESYIWITAQFMM